MPDEAARTASIESSGPPFAVAAAAACCVLWRMAAPAAALSDARCSIALLFSPAAAEALVVEVASAEASTLVAEETADAASAVFSTVFEVAVGSCAAEVLGVMLLTSKAGAGDGPAAEDPEEGEGSTTGGTSDALLSGVAVPLRAVVALDLERKLGRPAFFLRRFSEVRRMLERQGGGSPSADREAALTA